MSTKTIKKLRIYRSPNLFDEFFIGKLVSEYGIVETIYELEGFKFCVVFRDGGEIVVSGKSYLLYRN